VVLEIGDLVANWRDPAWHPEGFDLDDLFFRVGGAWLSHRVLLKWKVREK